jgi:NTE family protein
MRLEEVLPFSARDLLRLPARLLGLRRIADAFASGSAPERLYGFFNTAPLERLVVNSIGWREIRRNVREGVIDACCVAATQIATGRVVAFIDSREPLSSRWDRDPMVVPRQVHLRPTHALASAAIPMLFPAVRLGRNYFADGGLRLNTPLAPALRLGADRLLVVALRQSEREAHKAALARMRVADHANPIFVFGKVLNALMLDPLDTDLTRMRLVNQVLEDGSAAFGGAFLPEVARVAREQGRPSVKRIDDLVIRPSRDLTEVASEVLAQIPSARLRSPLLRLAVSKRKDRENAPESDLLSYLLFDGEFARPLAELGFKDAAAQEEALCRFFSDD